MLSAPTQRCTPPRRYGPDPLALVERRCDQRQTRWPRGNKADRAALADDGDDTACRDAADGGKEESIRVTGVVGLRVWGSPTMNLGLGSGVFSPATKEGRSEGWSAREGGEPAEVATKAEWDHKSSR
jgi:hypothetical protein